jgi:ABC-type Fe3+ transport system substrate-binding protein
MNVIRAIGLAASIGFAVATPGLLSAQEFPTDEAALYEAAKKEGSVVWYVGAPLAPMQAVAADFEKQYPGIKIDVLRVVGVQQYQRFMQETTAGQYIADNLAMTDFPSMKKLIEDDHIANWRVPTADRVRSTSSIGDQAYSNYVVDVAIVYNHNNVTAEEVEILGADWSGVLDPRFKDRFAVTSLKTSITAAGLNMFLDPALSEKFGEKYLKAVADQRPAVYSDSQVALDRVVAGEHDFMFMSFEAADIPRFNQGAPLRWVRPAPTPLFDSTWLAVSKYAPHPSAARLYQNWLMSDAGAQAIQTHYGAKSTLDGTEDNRPVLKEDWYRPITEEYNVDYERWERSFYDDFEIWLNLIK